MLNLVPRRFHQSVPVLSDDDNDIQINRDEQLSGKDQRYIQINFTKANESTTVMVCSTTPGPLYKDNDHGFNRITSMPNTAKAQWCYEKV